MLANLFQLTLEKGNAPADSATVDFQLRLAGAAHAERGLARRAAAGLACKMCPRSGEAGQTIFVLGQLDLDRAFCARSARRGGRRYRESTRSGSERLDLFAQFAFDLALLAGRELLVEDHDVGSTLSDQGLEFIQLARADERSGIRRIQLLRQLANDLEASRIGERARSASESSSRNRPGRLVMSTPTRIAYSAGAPVGTNPSASRAIPSRAPPSTKVGPEVD